MKLRDEILGRKDAAEDWLSTKVERWEIYEKLFHNVLADAISNEGKSQVFDPKLSTLTLERAYRVMGQFASGHARAISKNDLGTTQLMDLIVQKYVNPNANAQYDLLTKFRMVDIYSNIYGAFFVLVDWDVKKNGYIGPDMWLLNIRDIFPQVGAVSLEDSDYVIVRTWKPLSFFENLAIKKRQGYKNLPKIIDELKDSGGDKGDRAEDEKGERESYEYPTSTEAKQKGYFEVLSQYEGDRWVDFVPAADMEFRDTSNPHDDGELPVIGKYSIPLLDDFMGMGDFERGLSMQQVINSNWNLYLDGVKLSQAPPILINKDAVAVPSSIQYLAAAKWMLRTGQGAVQGAVSPLTLNPQGIATFNNTHGVANGSLQNLFGSTDTTVTQAQESSFGKTPQALQMQNARENTRDSADRFFMEQFATKVYKKFVNLISKKQNSAITIRMFEPEIQEMAITYPEIAEMYNKDKGTLTIDKKHTNSTLYDWEIVPGSTFALDQQAERESLKQLMDMLVLITRQGPQLSPIVQALQSEGMEVHVGELFKKIISKSGIKDWDKILTQKTPQEMGNEILNAHAQQFQQAMQMQGMNQTPPTPGQAPQMPQLPQAPPQNPMMQVQQATQLQGANNG
jgi:hypothetical protein